MKKVFAIILAAMMLVSLTALTSCTNQPAEPTGSEDIENPADVADTSGTSDTAEPSDATDATSDLAYVQDKGTLVVGITEYAPMNFKDENGAWTGFDTEFAEAVAAKLGVKAEFIEIEWDNKIFELQSKAIDCVWNGMTLTDEVLNAMNCSVPYVVNAQVLVMNKDKIADYTTVDSLADLSFVAEAGSAGAAAIREAGYEPVEVGTQADALMEVAAGAEDACVIDITMANAMTGEGTSYADLTYGLALTSEEYGIGFRKDSDLTAKVNDIINELNADGTLPALAEKYDLTLALEQ
ncbi:MAG: transporter substrate-binding domain-containing protein [Eubacteriales bacterium]